MCGVLQLSSLVKSLWIATPYLSRCGRLHERLQNGHVRNCCCGGAAAVAVVLHWLRLRLLRRFCRVHCAEVIQAVGVDVLLIGRCMCLRSAAAAPPSASLNTAYLEFPSADLDYSLLSTSDTGTGRSYNRAIRLGSASIWPGTGQEKALETIRIEAWLPCHMARCIKHRTGRDSHLQHLADRWHGGCPVSLPCPGVCLRLKARCDRVEHWLEPLRRSGQGAVRRLPHARQERRDVRLQRRQRDVPAVRRSRLH